MYEFKKFITGFICFCFISHSSFATDTSSVAINKGDQAPFSGVLLTPEKAIKLDQINLGLQSCQKISSMKDDENAVLVQRLNNAQNEEKQLASQVDDHSIWGKVGAFILGAAVTTGLAFAVSKSTK